MHRVPPFKIAEGAIREVLRRGVRRRSRWPVC